LKVGVTRFRRRLGRAVAVVVPIGVMLVGGLSFQTAVAQDETPTPGVLATPAAALDCATIATAAPAAATYTIVSEESAVRYRAQEELANIGAQEAVGETNAFIGQILFDASGMPMECSRFDADLRTLKSDESRRDNFLYDNTLETEQYPLATFILTSVEGLQGPLVEGEETTLTLIGDLTIHGVTKAVSWDATVTLDGDTLSGSASTTFNMADFNIEPPIVGQVISIDETITLEADITATQAA
jgi:polyisoprenoid-binding protein YceI